MSTSLSASQLISEYSRALFAGGGSNSGAVILGTRKLNELVLLTLTESALMPKPGTKTIGGFEVAVVDSLQALRVITAVMKARQIMLSRGRVTT
ncbi:MAG: hypothetical protein NTX58_07930 [Actinobacteria bacterium]|nr:hypothetical protein [Actinomycetota bacterium]